MMGRDGMGRDGMFRTTGKGRGRSADGARCEAKKVYGYD